MNGLRHYYAEPNTPKELLIATYQVNGAASGSTQYNDTSEYLDDLSAGKQKRSHNNEKQIAKNVSMLLEDLLK